ncbi:hypothetical protein KFL_003900100 [Klebsormidium nitens]|uniref:Queuosine 5'-phosphate N-glycosylase/hydrolase n=1 Tax=Klebsormidium nitens TaxID=105231 RepID=A0A1Y1IAM2_KLENI|nr:hypothetical protein KFL_003900100 [Klebsormidium nitens]|eukprot:GAQ87970.1 hypothetical protein KFL_003900100 [Klebsormidium nitens]
MDPLAAVRTSTAWVVDQAKHVTINDAAINAAAKHLSAQSVPSVVWNSDDMHYSDGGPLTVQYLFLLDALNFCFWPDSEFDYVHLAKGLKASLEKDKACLDADKLAACDGLMLRKLVQWKTELPGEEERARLVREVGTGLLSSFEGQAANLVRAANNSAAQLVTLVTAHFPGFRDHCVYRGRQVFLYKRAQIFVGDVWGAFEGRGLGSFNDIEALTMFADYLVPVVLREWKILDYDQVLATRVKEKEEIEPGSAEEVEIRAATILAVERLRESVAKQIKQEVLSLQIDWWLWQYGEDNRSRLEPHHRTRTIYY